MTVKPGDRVIARNLPRRPGGEGGNLPPTIALVIRCDGDAIRVKLRVGLSGPARFAPRARACLTGNVARIATAREVALGIVIDPLPSAA